MLRIKFADPEGRRRDKYPGIERWALFVRPAMLDIEPPLLRISSNMNGNNSNGYGDPFSEYDIDGIITGVYQTATDPDSWLVRVVTDYYGEGKEATTYKISMKDIMLRGDGDYGSGSNSGIFNSFLRPEHIERFKYSEPEMQTFIRDYLKVYEAARIEDEVAKESGSLSSEQEKPEVVRFVNSIKLTGDGLEWRWYS